jgi:hypothetical protein
MRASAEVIYQAALVVPPWLALIFRCIVIAQTFGYLQLLQNLLALSMLCLSGVIDKYLIPP